MGGNTIEDFKDKLILTLNRLKVFNEEHTFNYELSKLGSLVEEMSKEIRDRNALTEILGEVLGAFIVERCDNMLANTSISSRVRDCIHKLSLEAFKLYVHSTMKRRLRDSDAFVEYAIRIPQGMEIRAKSVKEVVEMILGRIERVPNVDGEKLLSSIIIDSVFEFEKVAPIIRQALSKGIVKLVIVPNDISTPLFFKEYYLSTDDYSKVKSVAIALDRIIKILKKYLDADKFLREQAEAIEELVRRIIGSESIDRYIPRASHDHATDKRQDLSHGDEDREDGDKLRVNDLIVSKVRELELKSLVPKLYNAINEVLERDEAIVLEICGKKVLIMPSTKVPTHPIQNLGDSIVIEIHKKYDNRIEIIIDDKVYQVRKSKLWELINNQLRRVLLDCLTK